jgi:hypothetical protein
MRLLLLPPLFCPSPPAAPPDAAASPATLMFFTPSVISSTTIVASSYHAAPPPQPDRWVDWVSFLRWSTSSPLSRLVSSRRCGGLVGEGTGKSTESGSGVGRPSDLARRAVLLFSAGPSSTGKKQQRHVWAHGFPRVDPTGFCGPRARRWQRERFLHSPAPPGRRGPRHSPMMIHGVHCTCRGKRQVASNSQPDTASANGRSRGGAAAV